MCDENRLIGATVPYTLGEIIFEAEVLSAEIEGLSRRKKEDRVLFSTHLTALSYSLNLIQGAIKHCHHEAKPKGWNYES
ncbi:MAG: hypothetical protein ACI8WB_005254 [Phenylobacterium sp.]|jgi:hypothetical protein